MSESEAYFPYESIAAAEVQEDPAIPSFVRSIFPSASEAAVDKFADFIKGKVHDGIQIGLGLSSYDPMMAADAFCLGADEAREILIHELNTLRGDE
ncbi:hypothetical protein H0X10_03300 [Candidatus Saccharibacteria bacterium]|nr:hypothetical protein [Candidatus Saccharibacteria bacterium]